MPPELVTLALSESDAAIHDAEAMHARFAELRETIEHANELGDEFVADEARLVMDALSRQKGSLLE